MDDYTPISPEDAATELGNDVDSAVNFIVSEFSGEWEDAQNYYNGDSGVPKVKGRSQVTSTNVRDAIRNLRPSLLRIFLHADSIVEYIPDGVGQQALAHTQSKYVNSLFFRIGGYRALYDAIQNAALKKNGILMYWWDDSPALEYYEVSSITEENLQGLAAQDGVSIIEAQHVHDYATGPGAPPIPLYNAVVAKEEIGGSIKLANVPLSEFFIDENATCVHDATVHGHRRSTAIHEALAMGLDYHLLEGLDDYDPEENEHMGESQARRGYAKTRRTTEQDPLNRRVLLTCAYKRYDFEGTGVPQLYKFYLGGTTYKYLYHEKVQSSPYVSVCLDYEPSAFWGKSIFDLQKQEQDTQTSLLRATCDNAHAANNRRLAAHEQLVNMDDVLNPALGAPIRVRAPGQIQEIGVQSSVGAMLPLLQYLQQQSEIKVGVTNAAMGLDHDALQSTTREAAQNTIQLSQGQIEVMARNVAEGLTDLFAGLLDLSMRHMPRQQVFELAGEFVQVDQSVFNPRFAMRPNVGLGTGQKEDKIAGLNFVLERQKEIIAAYGPMNPIVPIQSYYNTLSDMAQIYGVHSFTRYFNPITEDTIAQMQEIMAQQAENQPMDPAKAMLEAERLKAELRAQEKQLEFTLDQRDKALDRRIRALEFAATDDLERDRMVQQLYGAAAHKGHTAPTQDGVDKAAVKAAQNAPRAAPFTVNTSGAPGE